MNRTDMIDHLKAVSDALTAKMQADAAPLKASNEAVLAVMDALKAEPAPPPVVTPPPPDPTPIPVPDPVPTPDPIPVPVPTPVPALPLMTGLKWLKNHNSGKLFFDSVTGAVDYRLYEKDKPHPAKAAGGNQGTASMLNPIWTPMTPDLAAQGYVDMLDQNGRILNYLYGKRVQNSIEWNGLQAGKKVILVVQALDAMSYGPDMLDAPMPVCTEPGCTGVTDPNCTDCVILNAHSPVPTQPKVLAQAEIEVECEPRDLTGWTFFSDFRDEDVSTLVPIDPAIDSEVVGNAYRLDSRQFIQDIYRPMTHITGCKGFSHRGHWMTVLENDDQGDGTFALRPKGADGKPLVMSIANGKVAHFTFEIDAHFGADRRGYFYIGPKGAVLLHNSWHDNGGNPWMDLTGLGGKIGVEVIDVTQFDKRGPSGVVGPDGILRGQGQVGVSPMNQWENEKYPGSPWRGTSFNPGPGQILHQSFSNGLCNMIDNRLRYDILVSTTRIQVYEGYACNSLGSLKVDWTFPLELDFTDIEFWATHDHYHWGRESWQLQPAAGFYMETERFWLDTMPGRDQRHWNNIGVRPLEAFPTVPVMPLPVSNGV